LSTGKRAPVVKMSFSPGPILQTAPPNETIKKPDPPGLSAAPPGYRPGRRIWPRGWPSGNLPGRGRSHPGGKADTLPISGSQRRSRAPPPLLKPGTWKRITQMTPLCQRPVSRRLKCNRRGYCHAVQDVTRRERGWIMGRRSRQEYVRAIYNRYRRSSPQEKGRILALRQAASAAWGRTPCTY